MLMLCYVFMCFSLLVVVLDVFGVLALFSKFYIGVYYTCDCSCIYTECPASTTTQVHNLKPKFCIFMEVCEIIV